MNSGRLIKISILYFVPLAVFLPVLFISQNLSPLIYIWPTCFITGTWYFKTGIKSSRNWLLYGAYALFYTGILVSVYQFIYFKILEEGIM